METTSPILHQPGSPNSQPVFDGLASTPFSQEMVIISKQEHIDLIHQINYWKAQHAKAKEKIGRLEQEKLHQAGKIKDLQNRLFGKRSEKNNGKQSSTKGQPKDSPKNPRGQQISSKGHGRTERPDLPIINSKQDLPEDEKKCATCGLPHIANPALDEVSEIIEVKVAAHTRRIHRPAYTRNPGCSCEETPVIITTPPPARLIPRSPYDVSFWVEVLLKKFQYAQPTNRLLQDLGDQGFPVSAGTVAGGLQYIAPLFIPVMEALYCQQMNEPLFHNDETRWEVFVKIEGKNGSRWYLWVTRSKSVIYYCIDPSRSTAVPGAHFAGLQLDRAIIVCDRYSAYKKLAKLSDVILLAFCWAHVRRDFLDAGRSFDALGSWTLEWKERIGTLYHLNKLRLAQWNPDQPLTEQSADFRQCQQVLKEHLQTMWDEANQAVSCVLEDNRQAGRKASSLVAVKGSAEKRRIKVYKSLLNHWAGLTLFLENPEVPLDNNIAENSVRGPVTGRKAYYGSGSIWSAELAATLFSILQTLVLWGINPRHWLSSYLHACAENGGQAPDEIQSFIPWQMDDRRREILTRPEPS
jgi:transposase